jgi:protein-S-isoprenylcysteine O-methyltransferase Ste14
LLNGHWNLMGLRQAWGGREEIAPLRTPGPYRWVRHPMMVGTLLGLWATPEMSRGHLLFAGANLVYVLLAVRWEERDLVSAHGEEYTRYQRTVPRLCPLRWGGTRRSHVP